MVIKSREANKSLKKKGFIKDKGKDHTYYYYVYEGKKSTIKTKISHNTEDITSGLIKMMKDQLHLSTKQFKRLIHCSMDEEEYKKHIKDHGYLTKTPKYLARNA